MKAATGIIDPEHKSPLTLLKEAKGFSSSGDDKMGLKDYSRCGRNI
jgi:hypothetical protein